MHHAKITLAHLKYMRVRFKRVVIGQLLNLLGTNQLELFDNYSRQVLTKIILTVMAEKVQDNGSVI